MKKVYKANIFFSILIFLLIIVSLFMRKIVEYFSIPQNLTLVIPEILFLLIPSIIFLLITKESFKYTLRLNSINRRSLLLIISIGFLSYPVMSFIGALSQVFFHNFVNDAFKTMTTLNLLQWLLITSITPAICEEITMRGVIFGNYRNIDIKRAALMNGLMFGLFHLNPQQFFYAFALGVLFAYLVHITNSIFSSMICHFILNGISTTIAYISFKAVPKSLTNNVSLSDIPIMEKISALILLFVVAIIFGAIVILLIRKLKEENKESIVIKSVDENRKNEKVLNLPIYISLSAYTIFMIAFQFISKTSLFN